MKNLGIMIIDMQDFFINSSHPKEIEILVDAQKKLLNFASENAIPVFVLEYFAKGRTTQELKEGLSKNKEYVILKENDNGFIRAPNNIEETFEAEYQNMQLQEKLREEGIKNLILTGINKDACVLKTAKGAEKRQYNIFTAEELMNRTKIDVGWFYHHSNHNQTLNELLESVSKS